MDKLFKILVKLAAIIVIFISAYKASYSQCEYCYAYTSYPYDEYIYGVEFLNPSDWTYYISNWTYSQEDVADYTYYSADVKAGSSYYIYVYNGNAWSSDQVRVFIDWDQNCDFYGSDETYVLDSYDGQWTFEGYIYVPMSAKAGQTRMRVRMTYSSTPYPCDYSSFGEIEDYTLYVTPGVTLQVLPFVESEFCPGSKFQVSYEATGDYNWGNTFTAYLSDEFGNFGNPTILGSIQSTASGTIDCTLPDSAKGSYNYLIKIASSDPTTEDISDEFLTVYPLPIAYKVTGPGSYCINDLKGSSIDLVNSQVNTSYQLLFNGNPIGNPVMGTGRQISFGNFTAEGNYTVKAVSQYGCKNDMYGMVQVKKVPLPTPYSISGGSKFYNEPGDGTYCDGDLGVAIGMSKTDNDVDYTLVYNSQKEITTITGTGQDISFGYFTEEGNYTVTAVSKSAGCANKMDGIITVKKIPSPTKFNLISSGTFCEGEDGAEISLDGSQSGIIYQLQFNGNDQGAPLIGTGGALNFGKYKDDGVYTVIAQSSSGGCSSQMEGEIHPQMIPKPTGYNITGLDYFCEGTEGSELFLDKSDVGVSYQLFRNSEAIGTPIAGTGSSISFGKQNIAGEYTIGAISDIGSCTNPMNGIINLREIPSPEIELTGNMAPDFGSSENYEDAKAAEGDKLVWSVSGGEIVGSNTGISIIVDWGNNKKGKIQLTKTNAYGCTKTIEVDINLINNVVVDFVADNNKGKVPFTVKFTDKTTGYRTYWNWDFGDGKSSPVQNPDHTYNVPGIYTVKLTVGYEDVFINKTIENMITAEKDVGVNDDQLVSKNGLSISAIEPNPANDLIRFTYNISNAQSITIAIYNILGERVMLISDGYQIEGTHNKEINLSQLPSGAYLLQITGNTGYANRMINIMR
jgi:PKD repeat protein